MSSDTLTRDYAEKIEPLLPLAKRAYGSRSQSSPAHDASREYTRLLVEYSERGGNISAIARELGVTYAGVRRRVVTAKLPTSPYRRPRMKYSEEEIQRAADRITAARERGGSEAYHEAIVREYERGVSLAAVAKCLGLSSAGPLYYGVQSVAMRRQAESRGKM